MSKLYKKTVLISRSLLKNKTILEKFNELSEVVIGIEQASTPSEAISAIGDADSVVAGLPPLNKEVLDACPNLKVISNYGVGLDNIDLLEAKKRNIKIGWSKGVNKTSVAEIVLSRAIDLSRGLSTSQQSIKENNWINPKGREVKELRIGILGFGEIGKEVGKYFSILNASVSAFDINPDIEFAKKYSIKIDSSLESLLNNSDLITCHLPLTKRTRNLLNKSLLSQLPKNSYLINTSRGGIVNEEDLSILLSSGQLAGAYLDVFEEEPLKTSPLLERPSFLCSAHISGTSQAATKAMSIAAFEGLKAPLAVDEILKELPWLKEEIELS